MAQEDSQEQRSLEEMVDRGLRALAIDPHEAVPADFHARVMARAADVVPPPRPPRWAWHRLRVPPWALPALATGLVLSLACNVWLGVQLAGPAGSAGTSARLRLAFADGVREQDLRTLLFDLRATIIGGPSQEGLYTVQVPLPPPKRSVDPLRELLKELRDHPAVRLVEPASLPP